MSSVCLKQSVIMLCCIADMKHLHSLQYLLLIKEQGYYSQKFNVCFRISKEQDHIHNTSIRNVYRRNWQRKEN